MIWEPTGGVCLDYRRLGYHACGLAHANSTLHPLSNFKLQPRVPFGNTGTCLPNYMASHRSILHKKCTTLVIVYQTIRHHTAQFCIRNAHKSSYKCCWCWRCNVVDLSEGSPNSVHYLTAPLASVQTAIWITMHVITSSQPNLKLNSVALVRERTIPTERPPPVGEVSANFCGYRGVTWSAQRVPHGR